jgi:hypothetical protein
VDLPVPVFPDMIAVLLKCSVKYDKKSDTMPQLRREFRHAYSANFRGTLGIFLEGQQSQVYMRGVLALFLDASVDRDDCKKAMITHRSL